MKIMRIKVYIFMNERQAIQKQKTKKTAESHFAWFSSLLQTTWEAEKEQILIPTGSWFLRRRYFYFVHVF